jgi:UDP-N-acetylmuramate--alanine ligase
VSSDRAERVLDLATTSHIHIHIVGIGGAGMSAIATVLHAMGHTVSGSDLKDGPTLARLRASGMRVTIGHDAANVADADVLAISTAVPERNPEVVAARAAGIRVLSRAEVLVAICDTRRTVAIAGTHGKTTTSSMLALALREAGLEPSAIIGGDVNEIGTNALWGDGDLLVVEADESDGTFLRLEPALVIVTNVEPDHLDHYGSVAALEEAFGAFLASAERAVVCADDPVAARLGAGTGAVSYGTDATATYRIDDLVTDRAGSTFTVRRDGVALTQVSLPVPGAHNARNATAALAAGVELGAPAELLGAALGRFGGVARRFERRGSAAGVTFIDDYAHLPTEVRAALAAARDGAWERIVCVFQPHRYSRTAAVWRDFGAAFDDADLLVLTDIYAAGETPLPGVTGMLVVDAVLAHDAGRDLRWAARFDDLEAVLLETLRPGDLCLTLGAGDLTALPDVLIARLAAGS